MPDQPAKPADDWSIELLRGMAALMVMLAHYAALLNLPADSPWRFSFTGVDLFFILSGYVFAPSLLGKKINFRAHMTRRIFRIYPLYLVALSLYAYLHWVPEKSPEIFIKHLFFLQTLESFDIAYAFNPAFWSLPPEFEFYLALPLLAILINGRRQRLYILLAASIAAHLLFALNSNPLTQPEQLPNSANILVVHLPGLLAEFLLGSALWIEARWNRLPMPGYLLCAIGLIAWLLLAHTYLSAGHAGIQNSDILRGNIGLLAALCFCPLLLGSLRWPIPHDWLKRASGTAGNLSYGIYLFHNAMPVLFAKQGAVLSAEKFVLLCCTASLIAAFIAHHILEKPLREFGRSLAKKYERPC